MIFLSRYLDDILIASPDNDTNAKHLSAVFSRLLKAGLAINGDKCILDASEVTFLGHKVSSAGLVPVPAKLESIRSMQRPSMKVGLQRFLGCINYYHRFLPGIADVLAPLHALAASVPRPKDNFCLLYTSPSPRDLSTSRMPSSA